MTRISTNWSKTSILATISQAVVFIDSNVDNCQALAQGIIAEAEVIILQAHQDGIEQITKVLKQKQVSTVHLISHGSPGCLYLGNTQLSLDTLNQYASDLRTWFNPIPPLDRGGIYFSTAVTLQ